MTTNVIAIGRAAQSISTQVETRRDALAAVAQWLARCEAGDTMCGNLGWDSPVFISVDGGPNEALTAGQCRREFAAYNERVKERIIYG